jgi:hypothetical protein
MIFIYPSEGRTIRDPNTGDLIGPGGALVPDTSFWRRRVADGDVTVMPPRIRSAHPLSDPGATVEPEPETPRRRRRGASEE